METKSVDVKWSTPDGSMPDWLAGRRRRSRWDVERAVYEAYERTVWLWKGVSLIAGHAARLPFRYRVAGTDKVVDDHPIVRLLQPHSQVNPMEKGRAFLRRLFVQVLLSDRGVFVEYTRSRGGDIVRLDLLPPARTRAVPGNGTNLISHFETRMPDGSIRRMETDQVWWIREPHPLDPYRADTVMSSIGASVEMDDLARAINVHWMLNDGLVKAIVGIKGGLKPEETARLERRFGRGPVDAGKVTIVNADQVSYADVSARPKDMQYEQLTRNAREEVLGGIGVPESLLGISKGSTFDNAAQDKFNFWSETMPNPLELVAAELVDPNDDRDLEPYFDVSGVEALRLPERAIREEARTEFKEGLRTIESYAQLAGYEVHSTPETRALWLPNSGKELIPQTAQDVKAAQKRREEVAAQMRGNPHDGNSNDGGSSGGGGGGGSGGSASGGPNGGGSTGGGGGGGRQPRQAAASGGATAHAATEAGDDDTSGRQAGDGQAGEKTAALGLARYQLKAVLPATRTADEDQAGIGGAEEAAAAALTALATRWAARTTARLQAPKARKGTRHWAADPAMPQDLRVGTKTLDTDTAVDADSWEQEAEDALGPILATAALAAAAGTVLALTGMPAATGAGAAAGTVAVAAYSVEVAAAASSAAAAAAEAAKQAGLRLAAALAAADGAGESIDQIVGRVDAAGLVAWAKGVAGHAARTAVTGGMYAAGQAAAAVGLSVTAQWVSRGDVRVRATHQVANGQTQPIGTRFTVGKAKLRFPRDPDGPLEETIGCRCRLRLSVAVGRRRRAARRAGR